MIFNKLKSLFKREVFFIGKSDVLPAPLEKDVERTLIIKAQKGEIESRNKLIEHNLRLVVFIAKKFISTGYDLEDLVSIGSLGLIKGINTYKLDKNIHLATYASRCIQNEILMYIRKNKKRKSEISFEDALNKDNEGGEMHLEDILGTSEDYLSDEIIKKESKEILTKYLKEFPERDRQIMILRYGLFDTEEYTQKEVANALGISQSYISRIEKKVIKKLRQLMEV